MQTFVQTFQLFGVKMIDFENLNSFSLETLILPLVSKNGALTGIPEIFQEKIMYHHF